MICIFCWSDGVILVQTKHSATYMTEHKRIFEIQYLKAENKWELNQMWLDDDQKNKSQ